MSKTKKKCWSQSVGVYGSTVRVAETRPGGVLYLIWLSSAGKQRKRSLGHRDRKRGKEEALQVANRLATYREALETHQLTLGSLVNHYLKEGLHGRSEKHRLEARRKLDLVVKFFGPERLVESLSRSDVDRYAEARKAGRFGPRGHMRGGQSVPRRFGTIWLR